MYKEKLPYAQSALILGISSIITACCCWGVIGIILGIIGLNNANKAIRIHEEDPNAFDGVNNVFPVPTCYDAKDRPRVNNIRVMTHLHIWPLTFFERGSQI